MKGRRLREVLRGGKWGGQDGGQLDRFSALLQVLLKRSPPPPALRVLIAVEQDDDQRQKLPEKKQVDQQRDEHGEGHSAPIRHPQPTRDGTLGCRRAEDQLQRPVLLVLREPRRRPYGAVVKHQRMDRESRPQPREKMPHHRAEPHARQTRSEKERQPGGRCDGWELPDAHRRGCEPRGHGEESGIHQRQHGAPEVAERDATEEHRQRQDRKHRQQRINQCQRFRAEFARHNFRAVQVCEEQQTQCAIPFLPADAVGGLHGPDEQTAKQDVDGADLEYHRPGAAIRERIQRPAQPNQQGQSAPGGDPAQTVRLLLTRRGA